MDVEKIDYYMGLDYDTNLKKYRDLYYLSIPVLGVLVCNKELDVAYQLLNDEKKNYLQQMVAIGNEHNIPIPSGMVKSNSELRDLVKRSIIRSCIFILMLAAVVGFGVLGVSIATNVVLKKVESQIDRNWKDENLANADKLERFRIKLEKIRPYVKEIQKTFGCNEK